MTRLLQESLAQAQGGRNKSAPVRPKKKDCGCKRRKKPAPFMPQDFLEA